MARGRVSGAARFALAGSAAALLALPAYAASSGDDFVSVAPVVTSSIQTRTQLFQFDTINGSEYRAGTPVDGGGFEVSVIADVDKIFFRNGGIALGAQGIITSTTELVITLTNASDSPIGFNSFESVIIPAGMGFYTTLPFGGCGPLTPSACTHFDTPSASFQNLSRSPALSPSSELGVVGFDFRVLVDDVEQYGVAVSLGLEFDGSSNVLVPNVGNAPTALRNWRESETDGSIGYAWDETRFVVDLGNRILQPGESQSVRYISTVFAETYAVGGNSALSLLGYSAFGDPLPRPGGGGRETTSTFSSFARLVPLTTEPPEPDIEGLNDVGFFEFAFPTYDPATGRLTYPPLNPIPEPGTWAMLIAGFGLVGGSLRRRRAAIA